MTYCSDLLTEEINNLALLVEGAFIADLACLRPWYLSSSPFWTRVFQQNIGKQR